MLAETACLFDNWPLAPGAGALPGGGETARCEATIPTQNPNTGPNKILSLNPLAIPLIIPPKTPAKIPVKSPAKSPASR